MKSVPWMLRRYAQHDTVGTDGFVMALMRGGCLGTNQLLDLGALVSALMSEAWRRSAHVNIDHQKGCGETYGLHATMRQSVHWTFSAMLREPKRCPKEERGCSA